MGKFLGEQIQSHRLAANLSQDELADNIAANTGELINGQIIESWESGKTTPTIQQIGHLSKALDLNPFEINQLTDLKDQDRLITIWGNFETPKSVAFGDFLQTTESYIDTTGSSVVGAQDSLRTRVNAIENTLGSIKASVSKETEDQIKPISEMVNQLEEDINLRLHETQDEIKNYQGFVAENADFLRTAVTARARFDDHENRIGRMEGQSKWAWNRTTTLVSILIAAVAIIVGACCALVGLIPTIYFGYLQFFSP